MRSSTATIVEPQVAPEVITTMSQADALQELRTFAAANGHEQAALDAAIGTLKRAVAADGVMVPVHSFGDPATEALHDCLEDIVASPRAHDMALIVTDAAPGSEYKTRRREDACGVCVEVTNEPAA